MPVCAGPGHPERSCLTCLFLAPDEQCGGCVSVPLTLQRTTASVPHHPASTKLSIWLRLWRARHVRSFAHYCGHITDSAA